MCGSRGRGGGREIRITLLINCYGLWLCNCANFRLGLCSFFLLCMCTFVIFPCLLFSLSSVFILFVFSLLVVAFYVMFLCFFSFSPSYSMSKHITIISQKVAILKNTKGSWIISSLTLKAILGIFLIEKLDLWVLDFFILKFLGYLSCLP